MESEYSSLFFLSIVEKANSTFKFVAGGHCRETNSV